MTKKLNKICSAIVITGLICVSTNPIFSFSTPAYAADNVKIIECMKGEPWTRFSNILNFTFDTIIMDGVVEGLVEPFGDVIYSNSCQAGDLLALVDRQDQIERSIAKYLLSCDLGQFTSAQKEYYKMSAEIYYVRNIIDREVRFGLPIDYAQAKDKEDYFNLGTIEEKEDFWSEIPAATSESTIKKDMKKKFVKPLLFSSVLPAGTKGKAYILTDEEFENLFNKLADKYRDKKMTYAVCDFEPWQEITDKIKEFKKVKDQIEAIDKTARQGADKWGNAWQKLSNDFAGPNGLFKNPAGYFKSHRQIEMEGVDEFISAVKNIGTDVSEGAMTIYDISANYVQAVQKAAGNEGGVFSYYTISDAKRGVSTAMSGATREQESIDLENEIEALYISTDGMSSAYAAELVLMDKTIQASFPILKTLKSYSYEMQKTSYGPDGVK